MFYGAIREDTTEHLLTGTAGGRELKVGKNFLRFPGVSVPVGLAEISEGSAGRFWEGHRKSPSQFDDYW